MPGKLGGAGRGGVADQHCILQHLTLVILLILMLILAHVRVRVHIYGFTIIFAAVCYNQKSTKYEVESKSNLNISIKRQWLELERCLFLSFYQGSHR
jgi:hypothetical protein